MPPLPVRSTFVVCFFEYPLLFTWVLTRPIEICPLSICVPQELFLVSLIHRMLSWKPDSDILLLDLMHYRWNLVYVPWVNKDVRRSEFISNIISKPISYWLHHIIVWYSVLVFEAWQETRKRRAFMPPNKVYSRRTWTNRNYWHHPISCHSDLKATESSTPPDKVSLVPPSAPPLVRHPALSITTNLFGSAATRLTTRYYCFIPCFLPEDAVTNPNVMSSWRLMWYVQGLRHWHYF